MALQTAEYDLSTAFLDQPDTYGYGTIRGAGNRVLQQALTDGTRVVFHILGKGRWDSTVRLFVNNAPFSLAAANFHFHPGDDGEIGFGMAAGSTGGDNHVDSFFSLLPVGLDPITFSRYAWMALKVPPDPKAPSADLTVLGDFKARQVRIFDNTGTQTSFAWTDNWAWMICDYLIEKFVLREGKVNQPLVTSELARFDWQSFSDAAAYYDAVLSLGQKRFSDGGLVYLRDGETADQVFEQMLLICRSYLREPNGKFTLTPDQPRASVFTFTSDNVKPGTFKVDESDVAGQYNRFVGAFRDSNIASGSSDDAMRYAISSVTVNHKAHQRTIGVRGLGLSVIPKAKPLQLDLGNNTPERAYRILKSMATRQLGDDVDANTVYKAPRKASWTGYEDSEKAEAGDRVTIDQSLSEEFGGKDFELLKITYRNTGDRERDFVGLEYMPNAFPDVATTQQALLAPDPGDGLTTAMSVDANGNLQLIDPDHIGADGSVFSRNVIMVGSAVQVDNGNFEASAALPVPGWNLFGTGAVASYDSSTQFSGTRSLKVTTGSGDGGFDSVTKYLARPGDVFRISAQLKLVSGTLVACSIVFRDGSGASLGSASASTASGAWTFASNSAIAPAGTVYAQLQLAVSGAGNVGEWDEIHIARMQTAFEVVPLNTSGHSTVAAGALSQSGVGGTINVASRTIQFGDGTRTYSAGSVSPGFGTFFVYADDPGFAGGAVTYVATATESDVYGGNGRIFFGKITLTGGGGGASGDPPGTGGGRTRLN